MSSSPISLLARERLRAQQADEAKVVAAHTAATTRLESAISKRAEMMAAQDALVTKAEVAVAVASAEVAAVSGFARATAILGCSASMLRRQLATAKAQAPSKAGAGSPIAGVYQK